MPKVYKELDAIQKRLEKHYRDMQDIEFTIEKGRLWMLQCRVGKRNGPAAVRMAVDMVEEKLITKEEAVMRVTPAQLDELLHPIIDPKAEMDQKVLAKGLPAGPGGATGQVVFTAADGRRVEQARQEGHPRPRRDQPGGRRGHAGRPGHSDRPRRHDQPRGPGGPRLGQVLHRRLRRPARGPRCQAVPRRRHSPSRKATGSPSTAPRATSTPGNCR